MPVPAQIPSMTDVESPQIAYPCRMGIRFQQLVQTAVFTPCRKILVTGTVGAALCLSLTSCGKAEQEQKIAQIQKAADERVAKAEQDAREKVAQLAREVEKIKAEAADASAQAKAQVDEAVTKAQLSADEAAKAVQAALARAREAYKEDGRTHLAAINKEFRDLTTQAKKSPPKDRAAYDKAIKDVVAKQKLVTADIAAFDKAALETFKSTKAQLNKDLALMKAAVKSARAQLPKR